MICRLYYGIENIDQQDSIGESCSGRVNVFSEDAATCAYLRLMKNFSSVGTVAAVAELMTAEVKVTQSVEVMDPVLRSQFTSDGVKDAMSEAKAKD